MEAILACHPAKSTEWLDCHPKPCELWRIRTGPITLQDKSTGKESEALAPFPLTFDLLIPCITLKKLNIYRPTSGGENEWEKKWWEAISSTHWVFSMNNGKKNHLCYSRVALFQNLTYLLLSSCYGNVLCNRETLQLIQAVVAFVYRRQQRSFSHFMWAFREPLQYTKKKILLRHWNWTNLKWKEMDKFVV